MKKISTLYKKDPADLGRVINEVNPENQWAIDGEGIATRKFDGIASAIINGELYKRFDVKKGKTAPAGAIPCQEPDTLSGHHPHWVKCDRSDSRDKFFFIAFDALENKEDGTYELCGESISTERFQSNFNVEGVNGHRLIKHGSQILNIEDLSFEGVKNFLETEDIEGIVFHHPDGRMCKIRKKDFGLKREKKEYHHVFKAKEPEYYSQDVTESIAKELNGKIKDVYAPSNMFLLITSYDVSTRLSDDLKSKWNVSKEAVYTL